MAEEVPGIYARKSKERSDEGPVFFCDKGNCQAGRTKPPSERNCFSEPKKEPEDFMIDRPAPPSFPSETGLKDHPKGKKSQWVQGWSRWSMQGYFNLDRFNKVISWTCLRWSRWSKRNSTYCTCAHVRVRAHVVNFHYIFVFIKNTWTTWTRPMIAMVLAWTIRLDHLDHLDQESNDAGFSE